MKLARKAYVLGGANTSFIGKFHPDFIWKGHAEFGKKDNPSLEDYIRDAALEAVALDGLPSRAPGPRAAASATEAREAREARPRGARRYEPRERRVLVPRRNPPAHAGPAGETLRGRYPRCNWKDCAPPCTRRPQQCFWSHSQSRQGLK